MNKAIIALVIVFIIFAPAGVNAKACPLISYQVERGDTLTSLAREFNTSITDIKLRNGWGHIRRVQLLTGQTIDILDCSDFIEMPPAPGTTPTPYTGILCTLGYRDGRVAVICRSN